MKKALVLGLALALVGGVAYANFCARDVVPAATILVPYVVVDVTASGAPDDTGVTTITGITNVSRDAIVVHFTAWDATSDPKVDFDEILSGYDVIQINWRDFLNGRFDFFDTSRTNFTAAAPYIFDPFEWGPDGRGQGGGLVAPANRNTNPAAWPNCKPLGNAYGPAYGNRSDLAGTIQSLLQGVLIGYDHDGCGDPGNLRSTRLGYWEDLTADPTFFYVTADVVLDCNLYFPSNDLYWGTGIASSANVLVGDTIYLDSTNGFSEMMPAVHVEANQQWGRPDFNEFYGEKLTDIVETWREPLATAFAFRYANDTAGGISSHVILWKNYAEFNSGYIDDCGSYVYYAWDMDERSLSTTTEPISGLPSSGRDPNQFPFETQKVPLVSNYFDLPGAYGWMLIVLPPSYGTFTDPTVGDLDPTSNPNYQGWAGLTFEWAGYSAGTDAATMANANCLPDQVLPALGANTGVFPVDWVPAAL